VSGCAIAGALVARTDVIQGNPIVPRKRTPHGHTTRRRKPQSKAASWIVKREHLIISIELLEGKQGSARLSLYPVIAYLLNASA
jgi:hypothetical protein